MPGVCPEVDLKKTQRLHPISPAGHRRWAKGGAVGLDRLTPRAGLLWPKHHSSQSAFEDAALLDP